MSKDKLTDAIGGIGDDLIAEAKAGKPVMIYWRRIVAAAACLVILTGIFYIVLSQTDSTNAPPILQNTTATPVFPQHSGPSSSTVMPSTNNGHTEIPILVINGADMYDQLFLAAEDQTVFAQNQNFIKTFGNREALKEFAGVLNRLPIPQMEGAACTMLEYIPAYKMLNITQQSPDGKRYSFTFQLDSDRALEIREDFAKRNMLCEQEWNVPGSTTFKTITEFKKQYTIFDVYGCWIDIDGTLVNFSCDGLTGNVTAEAVLAQISIGNTLNWN